MGWSVGYDSNWERDVGYGVPATCDHPGCGAEINRGLSYICANSVPGGGDGCGLFFCWDHLHADGKCERCAAGEEPFDATPDHPRWIEHKATHPSWAEWRRQQRKLKQREREHE